MNKKAEKPAAMGDDLAGQFMSSMQPKTTGLPSLRGDIRKQRDDDDIEAAAAQIVQRHGGFTTAKAIEPEDPIERMTIALARSTRLQLSQKAASNQVTITHLINQALQAAGYTVPDSALVTDGRKRR